MTAADRGLIASILCLVRSLTVVGWVGDEVVVVEGGVGSGVRATVSLNSGRQSIQSAPELSARTFSFLWLCDRLAFGRHRLSISYDQC